MKTLEKIKEYSWMIIIGLMVVILFRQCGVNRDIDRIEKDSKKTALFADSTLKVLKGIHIITEDEVRAQLNQVMFNYLIYEDDLDKRKISLSDIKTKIDEDSKK